MAVRNPRRLNWKRLTALSAVVLAGVAAAVVIASLPTSSGRMIVSSPGSGGPVIAPTGTRHVQYPIRGIYGHDSSPTGFDRAVQLGFNVIDTAPIPARIDALAARGLKGIVWLGGFDNKTCRFFKSDAWIRTKVGALAGHRGVAAYYIDDEPDASLCPNAPDAIRARAALVHSLDPGPPTLIVTYHLDQLAAFKNTVDVIGLDHFPCSRAHGCNFMTILDEANAADRLGIRYWGVIQSYGDSYYLQPTPTQLDEEFEYWAATRMEGYLVFAWRWPPNDSRLWLLNNEPLQAQLSRMNRGLHPPG